MPRTHRDLRKSYLNKITVKGDVYRAKPRAPATPDSPKPVPVDIIPINPYNRKRSHSLESFRRSKSSERRISWSQAGDSVRTISPVEPMRNLYITDSPERLHHKPRKLFLDFPPEPVEPVRVHRPMSRPEPKPPESIYSYRLPRSNSESYLLQKPKKKKKSDENKRLREIEREMRDEAERKRRREKQREFKEKERRLKQEEDERRRRIREQQNMRWSQQQSSHGHALRKTRSEGNLRPKRKEKPLRRAFHPKPWVHVGDPTRKAFITKQQDFVGDYHF